MKFIINNIRLSLSEDLGTLKSIAAKKLKVSTGDIKAIKITKESVDARRKSNISIVYSILVETVGSIRLPDDRDVRLIDQFAEEELNPGNIKLNNRPIVIGTGPAGLFAGLVLAVNGYKPLIIERGERLEKRSGIVQRYWEDGKLDLGTNVQFGEGGAGTFSDGKLTTRINDYRCDKILEEFYNAGASEEILYKSKPHIGSDILKTVVLNLRKKIEENGGEIRFNQKMTSIIKSDGRITGIVVNENEKILSDVVVLAIGHSARDTYEALLENGVGFEQKPFSIGVRIEHPQDIINTAQFGGAAGHPRLGAADYQLFYKNSARTAYSFCMCPGGLVVAAASEPDTIVTNGMSEFKRDRENANSALVVSVEPSDFGSSHPLSGVEFQRKWERKAFQIAGERNAAPVQKLEDFVYGTKTLKFGTVSPSYTGNVTAADLNLCLPEFVCSTMKESLGYFDNKLRGFAMKDAVLTGVETRTSSPVRIPRGDTLEAIGVKGLYPAGEGAGYAGGIMSAAVDGMRIAEQIVKTYKPVYS